MKKSIFIYIAIGSMLLGCQKAEEMKYVGETCIVFGTTSDTLKPIVYSFLEHPESNGTDTILVPARIMGNRASFARTFRVTVISAKTTAVAGTHYVPLNPEYTMPADSGLIYLPVIVKNSDPALSLNPVKLALLIEANEYFGSNPKMQSAIITFSNTINEPSWWQYWMTSQSSFPKFSVTAYSLVTMVTGRNKFETTSSGDISLFYISIYSMLYVWTPFYNASVSGPAALSSWIENHPGWILTKHSSDEYYDFYRTDSPSVKFKYGPVSSGSSVYGFFDENGKIVSK
jgi:hypothetical protein